MWQCFVFCHYIAQTICSNADKQLEVEQKLAHISSKWDTAMFEFQIPVGKKVPLLELGPAVIEDLEVTSTSITCTFTACMIAFTDFLNNV